MRLVPPELNLSTTAEAVDEKLKELRKDVVEEVKKKPDPVSHPPHYTSHPSGVECITIIQHFPFNIGSAMKYLWRVGLKEGNDPITELLKARKYIDFEVERLIKELADAFDAEGE